MLLIFPGARYLIVAAILLACSASAQTLTEADLAKLDLGSIDQKISEISLEVARLKGDSVASSAGAGSSLVPLAPSNTTAALLTSRSRANALCFQDSLSGHVDQVELDAFFDGLGEMVGLVNTTIVAFDSLKTSYGQGACPDFMTEMLGTIETQVGSVSRRDLSDLAFHLESCWPDDGMTEVDGSPLDIDARYQRARNSLQTYGQIQRAYREAAAWCE